MKVSTTFGGLRRDIYFYTDKSYAFSISTSGLTMVATANPTPLADYTFLADGHYLKITGIDMI